MYACLEKVKIHHKNCGATEYLDFLIRSYLTGQALDKWQVSVNDMPINCVDTLLPLTEIVITDEQVEAFKETL